MTEHIRGVDHPAPSSGEPQEGELTGLRAGTLSMRQALGMSVVVFSPVLTAATVGSLMGGAAGATSWLSAVAGTLLMACVGVAILPFARRYVVSGALYSYINHAFGGVGKFIGGASMAVGYAVGMMVMLGAMGLYTGSALAPIWPGATSLPGQLLIYAVTVVSAGFLAYRSLDASARLSIGLLFLTAPVVAIVLIANVFTADFDFASQFSFADFSFGGFTLGMVLSATFFVGFESGAATALETKDPIRTMPRVIILVPLIVGGIAVIATLMSVPSLGSISTQVASGESPISAMAHNAGLGVLAPISDIALALTSYAVVIGFINYAPRVWATIAEDGLLPAALSRIHPVRQTPAVAIVVVAAGSLAAVAILAVLTKATPFEMYSATATLYPYVWVPGYVLICVGAIKLMREHGELTVGKAAVCVVGAVGSAWLYLNSVVNPSGTALDRMTWIAPLSIAVLLVAMVAYNRIAGKITQEVR